MTSHENRPRLHDHLHKLRHFVCVAEAGSLCRAAQRLHITQPTLSHSIKTLEQVCGTPLFLRTSRGVELTGIGEDLLVHARRILEQTAQIEDMLFERQATTPTTLTIGTKEPYAIHLFPDYFKRLERDLPGTTVSLLVERSSEELVRRLIQGSVDAVVLPDPPDREQIVAYKIASDAYHLFSPKNVNPPDENAVYIFRKALCGGGRPIDEVLQQFPETNLKLKDVDSFEVARSMALNGLGLALLPNLITDIDVRLGKLARVEREDFPTGLLGTVQICLCVHAKNEKQPAHRKLIRALLNLRAPRNSETV